MFRQAINAEHPDQVRVPGPGGVTVPVVNSTLLVDRFALVGSELKAKLEVRFQRSRSKSRPADRKDSLGAADLEDRPFLEPTQELGFIRNVSAGRFAVTQLPTQVAELQRWQVFTHNETTKQIESYNLERSEDGLFNTLGTRFFTCPDHAEFFATSEGTCPSPSVANSALTCGKDLIPITDSDHVSESAISFEQNAGSVTVTRTASLAITSFTIEAWVRPPQQGAGSLATQADNPSITFSFNNDRFECLGASAPFGDAQQWHHLAAAYDATARQISLYRDGDLLATQSDVAPPAANESNWILGKDFRGAIDEIRIWDHARAQQDIRAHKGWRITGLDAGLAAYWRFDEGAGDAVHDNSLNLNTGQRTGGDWISSDAPVADNPGIQRNTISFTNGTAVSAGMSVLLYSQQEKVQSGYNAGDSKPMKRNARVMLAAAVAATPNENRIAVLDFGVSRNGYLCRMPDLVDLTALERSSEGKVSMQLLGVDSFGLTLTGGLMDFARPANPPTLFDSATGKVAMYFEGPGHEFLVAYLDTLGQRAECDLATDEGTQVTCLARSVEASAAVPQAAAAAAGAGNAAPTAGGAAAPPAPAALHVTVNDGETADTCTVDVRSAGIHEFWNRVPRSARDFARVLNGVASESTVIGSASAATGNVEAISFPAGINRTLAAGAAIHSNGDTLHVASTVAKGATSVPIAPQNVTIPEGQRITTVEYDYGSSSASSKVPSNLSNGSMLVRVAGTALTGNITSQDVPGKSGSVCQWTPNPPGNAFMGADLEAKDQIFSDVASGFASDASNAVASTDWSIETWVFPIISNHPFACTLAICVPEQGDLNYCLQLEPAGRRKMVRATNSQSRFYSTTTSQDALKGLNPSAKGEITVEMWVVRPEQIGGTSGTILCHEPKPDSDTEPPFRLQIVFHEGTPFLELSTGGPVILSTPFDVNFTPRHIAVVSDGTVWTLYVNGDQAATGAGGGIQSETPWTLLANAGKTDQGFVHNRFSPLQVGDLRLWNRAKSRDEIREDITKRVTQGLGLLDAWYFDGDDPLTGARGFRFAGQNNQPPRISESPQWMRFTAIGRTGGAKSEEFALGTTWSHVAATYHQAFAVRLDGVTSYLDAGTDATLNITGDLTVEMFFRPDASAAGSAQGLLSRGSVADGNADTDVPYLLAIDTAGKLVFAFEDATNHKLHQFRTESAVPFGSFHRVAVTRKRVVEPADQGVNSFDEIRLYVDGAAQRIEFTGERADASADHLVVKYKGASAGSSSDALEIGRAKLDGSSPSFLKGDIAEVRIWDAARTPSEIAATISGSEKGLVSWWRFEENIGTVTSDSKSRNHARFRGGPQWVPSPDPNGPRITLYLNGEKVQSTRLTGDELFAASHPKDQPDGIFKKFRIGGPGLAGMLDEMRIWKTERTQEQIQDNLFGRAAGEAEDLLAYYPFDEPVTPGNSVPSDQPRRTIVDHSLRGNDLTTRAGCVVSTAPVGDDSPEIREVLAGRSNLLSRPVQSQIAVTEYGDLQADTRGNQIGVLKRCYGYIRGNQWKLVTGFKVGTLIPEWVSQIQTAPQVIGFIEGAPPIPSENLTNQDSYDGATSISFAEAKTKTLTFSNEREDGFDASLEASVKAGVKSQTSGGFGVITSMEDTNIRIGAKVTLETSNSWTRETAATVQRTTTGTTSLQLKGRKETAAKNPNIGPRFVPDNIGLALVKSKTADVFALRLKGNGALVSFQIRPNPDIPEDFNIITFPINPLYTKQGTLDGKIGLMADPDHYPNALTFTSDSSYYKPIEAFQLKDRIAREQQELLTQYEGYNTAAAAFVGGVLPEKLANTLFGNPLRRHRRNLSNTYVWTADGGLFSETEESLDVTSETHTGAYQMKAMAGLTVEADVALSKVAFGFELELMLGGHLNVTTKKGDEESSALSLNVDLGGVDGDIRKRDGNAVLDARQEGKVDAYRFITFYLEPRTEYFDLLFNRVIDPAFLNQSNDPRAVALREAKQSGARPQCWRVMHRVTFVSRVLNRSGNAPAGSLDSALEKLDIASNFELINLIEPFVRNKSTVAEFDAAVRRAIERFVPELTDHEAEIIRQMRLFFGIIDGAGAAVTA